MTIQCSSTQEGDITLNFTDSTNGQNQITVNTPIKVTVKPAQADKKPPTPPTNISSSTVTTDSIKIVWGASRDSDGSIQSYHVSYKKDGSSYGSESRTTNLSYTATALDDDSNYIFRIRAKDDDGLYSPICSK